MVSLFASRPRKQPQETARSLPPDMRQLIVDLRVEMPNMSIREIAEICDTRFHRRPSHHSIKTVLASGPPPSIQMRRFPLFDDTPDPAQRLHNIVQSMVVISSRRHPSVRKRCPIKPLGGTNIGASTYGILSITSFLISKAQSMS